MDLVKQTAEYDMQVIKIFARSRYLIVNLGRQVILQKCSVTGIPVTKDVFDEGDQADYCFRRETAFLKNR